jgi:hypothetical protein
MKKVIFSGTAQVEIQGKYVFKFVTLDKNQATYEVIGINKPVIRIIDQRAGVRRKMEEILKTGEVKQLADYFNTPARVTIFPSHAGRRTVRLEKTRAQHPRHMLWVAIGIGEKIPMYDYQFIEIQKMKPRRYALFSLYKRPHPRK